MSNDLYRILQVEPNADLEAIHAAYRRLARLYHPDLNPRPEAAEHMRSINAAYRVLSNPARRAAYDAQRYLPPQVSVAAAPPRARPVAVEAEPPTALQRRVDRIVAVLGVALLVAIGFYAVNVIPRSEQEFQAQVRGAAGPRQVVAPSVRSAASQPADDHPTSTSIPDRLRADAGLRNFPGTVLVAPSTLEPFANLPILRLDANSQGIARYAVYYGDLTTGVATISGLIGLESFNSAAPRPPGCAPDAAYCAGPGVGQTSTDSPGVELFRAPDLVDDYPAFVTHRVCCNGVFWSVTWYEPRANISYTIDLSRNVAARYGSPRVEGDVGAARLVAALATRLVRLP